MQFGEGARIGGERRGGGLEIADARHLGCAEPTEPLRLARVLRQAQREPLQHPPDQPGEQPPARLRAGREAGVDQQHRDGAALGREH